MNDTLRRMRTGGVIASGGGGGAALPEAAGFGLPNRPSNPAKGYPLWAYKYEHVTGSVGRGKGFATTVAETLRLRGAEGWELVQTVQDLDSARPAFHLFFKRPDRMDL
jgi:hypothetical protein